MAVARVNLASPYKTLLLFNSNTSPASTDVLFETLVVASLINDVYI